MLSNSLDQAPAEVPGPVLRLVLPAALLAGLPRPAAGAAFTLWHGPMVLQPVHGALLALVPRLNAGPPRALPPDAGARGGPARHDRPPDPQALALVVQASAGQPLPHALPAELQAMAGPGSAVALGATAGNAWDHWLARHAPEHRLATRARTADLLLLWCTAGAPRLAVLRRGDGWARLAHHAPWALPVHTELGAAPSPWLVVPQLLLPGAGMHRLHLPAPTAAEAPAPASTLTPAPGSRHSRQALALTSAVLQRLQQQRVGIVGSGLEGAALASSLVRLGVDVCALDPADMAAVHLHADLPPWCEGQPKVRALRRQLQGLARPGTQVDGRQLPVASPAAGSLLAACDIVVAAAPGPASRSAEAWALAMLKPLLVIATQVAPHGSAAAAAQGPAQAPVAALSWLALLPPGTGCLECIGPWPHAAAESPGPVQPALRSWSVMAANLGLRMLEHLVAGHIDTALVRELRNGVDGSLQVRDRRPATPHKACKRCAVLAGAGLRAAALHPAGHAASSTGVA